MTKHDFAKKTEDEVLAMLRAINPEQLLRLLNSLQTESQK